MLLQPKAGLPAQHEVGTSSAAAAAAAAAASSASSAAPSSSRLGISSALGSASASWRAAQHRGSVLDEFPMYSCNPEDYEIGREIGFGASSVVYEAKFKPLNEARVAVKVIDLEAFGRDTDELRRETQLMSLSKHPNVLRVRGCYLVGSKLHIATRLMAAGSMLDIMRFSHPDGFDEIVIATVLKQALQGLHYLHQNDWLHRDLKAANILVDDDGTVLLGDFGVGVWLGESSAKAEASAEVDEEEFGRKSFVGTPAWMAPEVVERKHYGVKADIWSLGITALELCQGRAPHARFAPVKALMKTLSDAPPQLDREGGVHKYSKAMEDFVRVCLQKEPAKRPTAEKLLQHALFKQARGPKFLVNAILSGLPPLSDRQERRRRLSISSMRTTQSWDFGSVGAGSGRWTPGMTNTGTADRTDPFLNFSGIFGNAASPRGSVRSSKIVGSDGQHAIAITPSHSAAQQIGGGEGKDGSERRSRAHSATGAAIPASGSIGGAASNRRSRNRSNDSGFVQGAGGSGSLGGYGGLRALAAHQREHNRRSISREPSIDESLSAWTDPSTNSSADSKHAHLNKEANAGATTANGKALETIGEQKSPISLQPSASDPVSTAQVPALDLPPSPFVEDENLVLAKAQRHGGLPRWTENVSPSARTPTPAALGKAADTSGPISEPSSRAVSSSTTASKATSLSSATTVMTENPSAQQSAANGNRADQGDGFVGSGERRPSANAKNKDGFAVVVDPLAATRVNSRSSQRSTSPTQQHQQAASTGTSSFMNKIRSISSRPASRAGPSSGPGPGSFGAGTAQLESMADATGSNEGNVVSEESAHEVGGHRRTESVLGKIFGRNKREGSTRA
ncbi:hypothetical protein V8E36_001318 [Tilletia maclaganii]